MLDELPAPIYTTDADGRGDLLEPRLRRLRRPRAAARPGSLVRHLEALHYDG